MASVTWAISADFDLNGSYETDLTGYIELPGGGIHIDRGMGKDGLSRMAAVTLDLSNRDGSFTPENSASSLYGKLEPDVPVKIVGTHSAVAYTLFTGYIKRYDVNWAAGSVPLCKATCDGLLGYIGGYSPVNVTTASRTTSAALTEIATAIGLVGADYTFATGAQALPVHYVRNQDAFTAFVDVLKSEMGGYLFETGDGKIQFDARNTRLGISVDDTWGDGTTIYPHSVSYQLVDTDLITKTMVQANIFADGQAGQNILSFSRNARTGDSLALTAGQIYEVDIDYAGPVTSIVTPVATTDYTAHDAADGTGTDRTGSLTVTVTDRGAGANIKLVNGHSGTIYVTKFEIRGQAQDFASDRPRFEFAKPIAGKKLDQGASIELPFADDSTSTRDYAVALCYTYRQVYPRLVLNFDAGSNDATMAAMLGVELGDLVKYKDTLVGASLDSNGTASAMVDDWWYVEGIKHSIPPNWAQKNFRTTVTLIPSYIYRNLDKCVYDTFARTNVVGDLGTSLSGDVWANDGNVDINSGAARANSDTLQVPDLDLGASVADMVVEVTMSNIGAGDEVGLTLRKTDASNYYNVYVDKGSNEVICEKNVASVVTELASPAFTVGTGHEIRAMIQGTRIRAWVDRKLYIDVTDSALTTGTKAGLWLRNANATTTVDDMYGQGL